MAKKRKNTKGTKNNFDNRGQQQNPKSRAPKRNNGKGTKKKLNGEVDDYQLREKVEADGTLEIVDMNADGNCLFRALSDQLNGDHGGNHDQIRADICDYMEENKNDFSVFLVLEDDGDEGEDATDFESYVKTMRDDGVWGGHLELVAASRIYGRKITVFSATLAAFTIDHGEEAPGGPGLMLSYHDNDHYNSVRNKKSPPKMVARQQSKRQTHKKNGENGENHSDKRKHSTHVDTTISSMSELAIEDAEETETSQNNPTKKNSQCPCGSNLKYKKCCLAKEKRAARLKKMKENSIDFDAKDDNSLECADDVSSIETKGGFRVLNI